MVFRTYITKGVGIKMDQEIKDYLERKLTLLATKDDIEKIRQETNVNFRKLKEENKSQATEWRQEIKADMEKITPTSSIEIGPIREEMKEWVRKIEDGTQFALSQFELLKKREVLFWRSSGKVDLVDHCFF